MYPRTNYEMTQADLETILAACKATPVMFLSGGTPMGPSQQENANSAWAALGKKMGFDHMTVRPIEGKGQRFFSAIPSENATQRDERLRREAKQKRKEDIAQLEHKIAELQSQLGELLKDKS